MMPFIQCDGENLCPRSVESGDLWEDVQNFWRKSKQYNNESFYTYLTGELLDN